MKNVLIIGAGGVGAVVAHKCAQVPEVFGNIMLASRTKSRCDAVAADLPRPIWMNVGRLAVEKNLEAFLELDLPGTKVIVGEGPQASDLFGSLGAGGADPGLTDDCGFATGPKGAY